GTLVDDDLVLTAQHCVVRHDGNGNSTKTRLALSEITFEFGGTELAWNDKKEGLRAKAIVSLPCGEQGGAADVAILVLERKMVGITPMKPRLDAPPKVGDSIYPIGFGRCQTSTTIKRNIRL